MGSLSRNKGKAFELLVARSLRVLYPNAKRGNAQYRNNSQYEDKKADVEETPWWVECSHGTSITPSNKMLQAIKSTDGRVPVIVTRYDHCPIIASMRLDDFVALLREREVAALLLRQNPELYHSLRLQTIPKVPE